MAKPARKSSRPVRVDTSGPSDPIEVVSVNENWSECTLEDGTIIRIRPVVAEVRRQRNKFDDAGEPIYNVKTALLLSSRSPKKLHKKAVKSKKKKT